MLKARVEYFKNLDGLRFLCFISVFAVHSFRTENAEIQSNFLYKGIVQGLFAHGGLGVNFFFVLSGFLITYLLILEKQSTGSIKIVNFWIKRILRIWPLYFLCLFFGFFIFPLIKQAFGQAYQETADLKLYLLFLGNFDIVKNGWPESSELGILWSISIEEQFYLVWPVLLSLVRIEKYWIVFVTIIFISLIFRGLNDDKVIHYYHTLSCISDMAVGGFGAWLIHISSINRIVINLSKIKIVIIYLAFILIFLFKEQLFDHFLLTRIFERLVISILIILIILEQNYCNNSFYKMGNFKKISELGLTTYGMYMLHIIAILIVVTLFSHFKLLDNIINVMIICPLLSLILTIYMSKLSYNLMERRVLRLRKYLR